MDMDRTLVAEKVARARFDPEAAGFLPVPLAHFPPHGKMPLDVFLPRFSQGKQAITMTLALPAGRRLSPESRGQLIRAGFEQVYIRADDLEAYLAHLSLLGQDLLASPHASLEAKAKYLYHHAEMAIRRLLHHKELDQSLAMGREYVQKVVDFIVETPNGVQSLCQVLSTDYSLYTHSVNVCFLTVSFASHLKIPREDLQVLGLGALFHDLGKAKIPPGILHKGGPLKPEEWEVMRRHPESGYQMLRRLPGLKPDILRMVHQHHENLDGSGYPRGLDGSRIAFSARLLRILDSYDAMTSRRCYQDARPPLDALRVISEELTGKVSRKLFQAFVDFHRHLQSIYLRTGSTAMAPMGG